MNTSQILRTVLNKMPNEFTSMQFCKEARKHKIDEKFIHRGNVSVFLLRNANNIKHKTWRKLNFKQEIDSINQTFNQLDSNINKLEEIECIKYLKQRGYRIQKIEYKEI